MSRDSWISLRSLPSTHRKDGERNCGGEHRWEGAGKSGPMYPRCSENLDPFVDHFPPWGFPRNMLVYDQFQHGFADQFQLLVAFPGPGVLCQHGIHQETRNLGARRARCALEKLWVGWFSLIGSGFGECLGWGANPIFSGVEDVCNILVPRQVDRLIFVGSIHRSRATSGTHLCFVGDWKIHPPARYYQSTVEEPCPTIEVLYGLIQLNQPPMAVDLG